MPNVGHVEWSGQLFKWYEGSLRLDWPWPAKPNRSHCRRPGVCILRISLLSGHGALASTETISCRWRRWRSPYQLEGTERPLRFSCAPWVPRSSNSCGPERSGGANSRGGAFALSIVTIVKPSSPRHLAETPGTCTARDKGGSLQGKFAQKPANRLLGAVLLNQPLFAVCGDVDTANNRIDDREQVGRIHSSDPRSDDAAQRSDIGSTSLLVIFRLAVQSTRQGGEHLPAPRGVEASCFDRHLGLQASGRPGSTVPTPNGSAHCAGGAATDATTDRARRPAQAGQLLHEYRFDLGIGLAHDHDRTIRVRSYGRSGPRGMFVVGAGSSVEGKVRSSFPVTQRIRVSSPPTPDGA